MAYSDFGSEDTIARSKRGTTSRSLGATTPIVTTPKEPGNGFLNKVEDVGKQTLDIGKTIAEKSAGYIKNATIDIAKQAYGAGRTFVDAQVQPIQNKVYSDLSKELGKRQDMMMQDYKSGKLSKEDFQKQTAALNASFKELNQENEKIILGPTPQQRASDVANTAINVLSLGSFTTETALGKDVTTGLVTRMEDVISKVPAAKSLIERNAASIIKTSSLEGFDLVKAQAKDVVVGLLIKRPVFYQSNIGGAEGVYKDLMTGKYGAAAKSSAWLATQMLDGGPIGAALKLGTTVTGKLRTLSYGTGSFLDEVGKRTGNDLAGDLIRLGEKAKTGTAKEKATYEEALKTWRILQETNLQMASEDVSLAADNFLRNYADTGVDLKSLTPDEITSRAGKWVDAQDIKNSMVRKGLIPNVAPEEASRVVVVRWDSVDKQGLSQSLAVTSDNIQERMATLQEIANAPGTQYGNNELLMKKLENILINEEDVGERIRLVNEIQAASLAVEGVPKAEAKKLGSLGYILSVPKNPVKTPVINTLDETRKLVTAAINNDANNFTNEILPNGKLAAIAGTLEKMGVSPKSSNIVANRALSESVVSSLDEVGIGAELGLKSRHGGDLTNGGQALLNKLQSYIDNMKANKLGNFLVGGSADSSAVTDIRQLTKGEIAEALGVTKQQAKLVKSAITDAYAQVPMSLRGLGDHLMDKWYQINPLQGTYSRAQSALRYTYNPFFKTQEAVETNILSGIQGGNRFKELKNNNFMWNKTMTELDSTITHFENAGFFSSSLPGEAAQDQVLGRLSANITRGQKRDLSGLALDMARSRGLTVPQMLEQHPDELEDALRVVVQYSRKGVLASPLARTMNLVFFPVRYNAKVTLLAANVLAKQPPSIQLATLHSLFQMKDWLKSDEGISWQAAHSDAIQLFNWITPINSVEQTLNTFTHRPDSVGDLGQLGGLPFGVISQVLDSQGIIHLNTPYVNPKTGDVFPDYIPQTAKARAAVATTDLLNSMFTYPGRILGLPGKKAAIQDAVRQFIATNGTDFEKRLDLDRLTPLQANWVRVLKGDTSEEAVMTLYTSPAAGQFNGYTLPPLTLPLKPKIEQRTGLPSKTSPKKAKNVAQPIAR